MLRKTAQASRINASILVQRTGWTGRHEEKLSRGIHLREAAADSLLDPAAIWSGILAISAQRPSILKEISC